VYLFTIARAERLDVHGKHSDPTFEAVSIKANRSLVERLPRIDLRECAKRRVEHLVRPGLICGFTGAQYVCPSAMNSSSRFLKFP